MRRSLKVMLPAMVTLGLVLGCAVSREPVAVPDEAQEAQVEVQEDVWTRDETQNDTIDDGRSVLADLLSPINPIFKQRTYGELTQVSRTQVGGDNSVDTSPAEDLIAFSSDRHGADYNIYVKAPSGNTVTRKTSEPFDDIQPAFSPDGKRIAFASNKNGNYDIWIIDTHKNGAPMQVTFGEEDELHPSWMPDGNAVIYSAYSSRSGEWDIMLTDLTSAEVRDLGRGKFPKVGPDGRKILFQRARQREGFWYSIWTMNLDGTDQTEIISSADWAAINPCWSPDGRYVAFATVYKSPEAKVEDRIWRGDDIYVVGVDGRSLLQVTADPDAAWSPCWSRRDGKIYFVSERNGFRNIWSIKPCVLQVASSAAAPAATATE